MRRKWDYDWITFDGKDIAAFERHLDVMGAEGWELSGIFDQHGAKFFVLKREAGDVPADPANSEGGA